MRGGKGLSVVLCKRRMREEYLRQYLGSEGPKPRHGSSDKNLRAQKNTCLIQSHVPKHVEKVAPTHPTSLSRHPGLNNEFQKATMSELALKYNDQSVLENFHAALLG